LSYRIDIDMWEATSSANKKAYGFEAYDPGPALRGHCIPSDPLYHRRTARHCEMTASVVELDRQINTAMTASV
jgi:UDP-N-acetyl-D-mannosaminuronate dehydrogenase